MPASHFGRFELLERLGTGGAGEVLLVGDGARRFALKRLLPHLEEPAAAAAFEREAALAARLSHPNVVEVLEHGRIDGVRYVLMEYVDGKSLHQLLRACGRLPPAAAAYVAREVCRALAYVHGLRDDEGRPLELVHRDISPSNVLLSRRGEVKLCDFGIAKLSSTTGSRTQPGFIKGKRGYLSPEQQARETLDARSDLFAVGVVLFEALTGQRPREDGDRPSRLSPELPVLFDRICARALAATRGERYDSAAEMAADLDEAVAATRGEAELAACLERWFPPRPAVEPDPTHTVARLGRGRRWLVAALAAGAVAAALFVVARRRASPAPAPARVVQPATPPSLPAAATAPPAARPAASAPAREPPGAPAKPATKRLRSPPSRQPNEADYMPDPFHR